MKAIAISFLSFLMIACGKQPEVAYSSSPQVEALADQNAYPSVVMVVLPEGAGICTGTFISPRAVLTAAHCTQEDGRYSVMTAFGTFSTYTKLNLSEGLLEDPYDVSLLIFASDVAKRSSGQVAYLGSEGRAGEKIRLVGYGCNNLDTRRGAGIKRAGTNRIDSVGDYVELKTPFSAPARTVVNRPILGPQDEAGSCFGDSGGPMFRSDAYENALVGITHAGGSNGSYIISQYLNLAQSAIQNFLHDADSHHSLGIYDYCNAADSIPGACSQSASMEIMKFLENLCMKIYTAIHHFIFR